MSIRDKLPSWSKSLEYDVPLVGFVGSEHHISAMQVVHDANDPIALVELEVVEVMSLRGTQEWKVVAGVIIEG